MEYGETRERERDIVFVYGLVGAKGRRGDKYNYAVRK